MNRLDNAGGVIIRVDATLETMPADHELGDLQKVVGGYVEYIAYPDRGVAFVVNEEGMMRELPVNALATRFLACVSDRTDLVGLRGDVVMLANGRPSDEEE